MCKKKERERNRKYKIIGREVATVHNITPRDAFFILLTSVRNRSSSLQKLYVTGGNNMI